MESSEIVDLRDELREKEKELSGMQNLLLEQDEDIRACQQRLGELESTLLLACPPSSTASITGDDDHCLREAASPRHHPVQRTLYESASTEAAATSDADAEEQSEELSPKSCGGRADTPSTPGTAVEERSQDERSPQSPRLDIYGRRLDRSFRIQEEAKEPNEYEESDTITADVQSGGDQQTRGDGRPTAAERVVRAEQRAEAAEAAAREAAAAAATAVVEAKAAKDEAERLRAEVVELSRWREAMLNLRDVLQVAQRDGQEEGDNDREERRSNENDLVARHAKWVPSPALKTLLPRLHQNARDLLGDLAAAHGSRAPAVTATPRVAGITGADDQGQAGCTASQEASERPRGEADSRNAEFDGAEPAAPVDVASPCGAAESNDSEKQRDLLRKECKTLQIVIHALRVKDEECQKRIFALEGEVLQASLAAVKQEALISTLRRQLEFNGSRDAPVQRPQLLTPRQTDFSAGKPTAAVCSEGRNATPLVVTPAARSSAHDRRQGGVNTSRTSAVVVEEEAGRHPRGKPRTPTTDILRRLLYENTPKSSTSCAAESGTRTRIADEEGCNRSDHMAQRSRHGRRLFAEGSTVLRSRPASSGDVARSRRGPAALFSDPACGTGGVEIKDCSGVLLEREEGKTGAGKSTLLGSVQAVVGEVCSDEDIDQMGGQLATGETVLRERLQQAREEFSALRTGASMDLS